MSEGPKEQEPGRGWKIGRYKEFRRAQKTAEKALGNITLEDALSGAQEPSALIEKKDLAEGAKETTPKP